jgi:hypothetical protein
MGPRLDLNCNILTPLRDPIALGYNMFSIFILHLVFIAFWQVVVFCIEIMSEIGRSTGVLLPVVLDASEPTLRK